MLKVKHVNRHLGIVMAKGESERLPKKNLLPVGGRPMCCHPLETLILSDICHKVIVSTTTEELANVVLENGADDVVMREKDWDDNVFNWDTALYNTISTYEERTNHRYDCFSIIGGNICFSRPSWFRTATYILQNFALENKAIQRIYSWPVEISTVKQREENPPNTFHLPFKGENLPNTFYLPFKGIICDIDDEGDYKLASTIADLIVSGKIVYPMNEFVHDIEFLDNNVRHYGKLQRIPLCPL